jgi:hypothetical protein
MHETLLLCRDCGILLPLDSLFLEEIWRQDPSLIDEKDAFLAAHQGHGIEPVARVPESALYDRPPWDPMSTSWFRVRAGEAELVVRCGRSSIDEPRSYQLIRDPLPEPDCRAEVDEGLLRNCLDRHFFPRTLPSRKRDCFVALVTRTLSGLDARRIDTSFDDVEVANAAIAPFPCELSAPLLAACTEVFDPEEIQLLEAFIAANRLEDGALAVRVRKWG